MLKLFDKTTNPNYLIRRIGVGFNNVQEEKYIQLDFFINTEKQEKEKNVESDGLWKTRKIFKRKK